MDRLTELFEAKQASEMALQQLDRALAALKKAKNWGMFDFFSDGILTNVIKRKHIREANQEMDKLQDVLKSLSKELQDVQKQIPTNLNDSFLDTMFDVVFDNLITDFLVQREIKEKLQELIELREKILAVDAQLGEEMSRYQ